MQLPFISVCLKFRDFPAPSNNCEVPACKLNRFYSIQPTSPIVCRATCSCHILFSSPGVRRLSSTSEPQSATVTMGPETPPAVNVSTKLPVDPDAPHDFKVCGWGVVPS